MISLFLDTSSHNIIISVYKECEELIFTIEKNDNHLSERILPIIDQTLAKVCLKIQDIDRIFIVNGPGSFTGTRIGVAVAKTLAWTKQIKTYPVSELEVLASGFDGIVIPMIDARRGYVYAGIYQSNGKQLLEDQYIFLNDLLNRAKQYQKVIFTSYDDLPLPNIVEPKIDLSKVIKNHWDNEGISPHVLNPNYLKKTEAEEKINDKKN